MMPWSVSCERPEIKLWSCAAFCGLKVTINNRISFLMALRDGKPKSRESSSLEFLGPNAPLASHQWLAVTHAR